MGTWWPGTVSKRIRAWKKLGKKWLGEVSHDVTPIMEGIEFKRPTPKPDPFTAMWGSLPIIVNKADKKVEKKAGKKK